MSVDWYFKQRSPRLMKVDRSIEGLIVSCQGKEQTETQQREIEAYNRERVHNSLYGEPDPVLRFHLRMPKR
jgi:hypothetical protein